MAKTIMLVDDELDLLKVTSFRLKRAGYEVVTAVDGQAALDLLKGNKPDLVLLDVHLPIIDGYEVCKRMKENEELKQIPVIFFSATSSAQKIEAKTKELNAQGYLIKPFEAENLINIIKKLIG
ncbi:MAG: response regulator [Candidatus Omnitrophica bacterium]|nr:response regulator [Candidatus Omnitrophota bacterium]MDD5355923.1 response regulator [Candidatus Omnitrophota bacterium]